jgi:hypothetical protein
MASFNYWNGNYRNSTFYQKGEQYMVLSIEELAERWYELNHRYKIRQLTVTEQFSKKGLHKFDVIDLAMELDNRFATCCDKEDVIYQNCSILMMFLKDRCKKIQIITENGNIHEQLVFPDGYVIIKENK